MRAQLGRVAGCRFRHMFTSTEKKYLLITLVFLASGSAIKAYRHAQVKIGPSQDSAFAVLDSLPSHPSIDSLPATMEIPATKESPDSAHSTRHSSPAANHKPAFTGKLSLNKAGQKELMSIRGIGEKTAQLIIKYRQEHGPFKELTELVGVKGIGEKKLEKIIPFLIL
jgi:competence ComEA-like helix-hairpin-helix protein